ncbi:tetratricopeptide repeat protein, partial [Proteus mirabilis]
MKKLLLCLFLLTPVSGMAMNCEIADVPLCDKAKQGDSEAQVNLGVMYALGQGVEKDYAKAKIWYEKSASQGNSLAQHNLGVLYNYGLGVPQDYAKA